MRNYVGGGDSLVQIAPYDVASGSGFQVGSFFYVAKGTALAGNSVACMNEGRFDLAKATGQSWTAGVPLYWDNTAKLVTTTAASNKLIGGAELAQASADTIGRVILTGQI